MRIALALLVAVAAAVVPGCNGEGGPSTLTTSAIDTPVETVTPARSATPALTSSVAATVTGTPVRSGTPAPAPQCEPTDTAIPDAPCTVCSGACAASGRLGVCRTLEAVCFCDTEGPTPTPKTPCNTATATGTATPTPESGAPDLQLTVRAEATTAGVLIEAVARHLGGADVYYPTGCTAECYPVFRPSIDIEVLDPEGRPVYLEDPCGSPYYCPEWRVRLRPGGARDSLPGRSEVLLDLLVEFVDAVRGRDDIDGEIGSERPVRSRRPTGREALAGDKGGIGRTRGVGSG
jgi:hypothetical protein